MRPARKRKGEYYFFGWLASPLMPAMPAKFLDRRLQFLLTPGGLGPLSN
jgi:hypothetical protein